MHPRALAARLLDRPGPLFLQQLDNFIAQMKERGRAQGRDIDMSYGDLDVVGSFAANAPWQGMATTNTGGRGFLAGNGVYVLETANGYAELGVKLR